MTGAAYNRGNSEQSVGTPRDFLDAVEKRFGTIGWDLAATYENKVASGDENFFGLNHWRLGYRDAIEADWFDLKFRHWVRWLNPPFGNISPWAEKCAECQWLNVWTLFLVPYSAGSNWWRDYVRGKAMVFALQPRLKFIGHTQSYPKDLALCAYGFGVNGEDNWRWK